MIIDAIYVLASVPIYVLKSFFTGITLVFNAVVPDAIYNSIGYFLGKLMYFNGVFPVDTLLQVLSTLASFYTALYIIKIAIAIWSLVPFIGRRFKLPSLS